MAGLKEIRIRITSIKSTQQITSAMKMVSASKLRKAQMAILKLRPYAQKFNQILKNLGSDIDSVEEGKYSIQREANKILIVVINSNRGLCGSFNSNIIKASNNLIETQFPQQFKQNNVSILTLGRKAFEYFNKRKYNIAENNSDIFDHLTYDNAQQIAEKIINLYTNKDFDKVMIVYNKFKNAVTQELTVEQFLPIVFEKPVAEANKKEEIAADYIFEPSQKEILGQIIPNYLKMNLYRAILESYASEHGARMTSMHIATDNASEILKQLSLSYNKARQASITNELLEIVSGAEALKG
jgi:F-type H+-transporting ATPase subunit gamma